MPDGNTGPIAPRLERLDTEQDREGAGGITPLESNALGLRDAMLRPGPAFADVRPWPEKTQTELIDPPSVLERRLRLRIGEMIAAQVVEDEAGLAVPRGRGRLKATATLPMRDCTTPCKHGANKEVRGRGRGLMRTDELLH